MGSVRRMKVVFDVYLKFRNDALVFLDDGRYCGGGDNRVGRWRWNPEIQEIEVAGRHHIDSFSPALYEITEAYRTQLKTTIVE